MLFNAVNGNGNLRITIFAPFTQQIRLAGAFRLRHAIADSTRLVKAPEFCELHAAHGF